MKTLVNETVQYVLDDCSNIFYTDINYTDLYVCLNWMNNSIICKRKIAFVDKF